MTPPQAFQTAARIESGGRIVIALPFDPAAVWGERDRFHVAGTIDGRPVRGPLRLRGGQVSLVLGPSSGHQQFIQDGDVVDVSLHVEGPQATQLSPDIAGALDAVPDARRAFDSLATFYRRGWLRWIDATKRRPDIRAARIADMVELVRRGHKQRPH